MADMLSLDNAIEQSQALAGLLRGLALVANRVGDPVGKFLALQEAENLQANITGRILSIQALYTKE